jgi:hypothetical protein
MLDWLENNQGRQHREKEMRDVIEAAKVVSERLHSNDNPVRGIDAHRLKKALKALSTSNKTEKS